MKGTLKVFDVESTGIDVEQDRIVTATVGTLDAQGQWIDRWEWLINPGIPIPQGAIDVHGVTNEKAATGQRPKLALYEIAQQLSEDNLPVVIYNASYDTSILDRELRRHGLSPIEWPKVIDPLVLDKVLDKYRKGSRKLVHTAAQYGITVEEDKAHDAAYDCWLAGNLALKMRPQLHQRAPKEGLWPWLMNFQREAKLEQAKSLSVYFRKKENDPTIEVNGEWPMQKFGDKLKDSPTIPSVT